MYFDCFSGTLTMSHRLMITQDLNTNDTKSRLISHKLLLTNLIKVYESEVKNLVKSTKQRIKQDDLLDEPGQTYLDKILETSRNSRISSKFAQNGMSIRKGICCFEDDLSKCDKPALPFSRHCQRHILYNVDQLLFVRCTAKDSETSVQCSNPSLDVCKDEPLCNHHLHIKSSISSSSPLSLPQEDNNLKANCSTPVGVGSSGGSSKGQPQTDDSAGGRPKKLKKRRKISGSVGSGGPGNPASVTSIDSSSMFSQDSTDDHFLGLANNILTSLTTEQQQQLNELIEGVLASGSI